MMMTTFSDYKHFELSSECYLFSAQNNALSNLVYSKWAEPIFRIEDVDFIIIFFKGIALLFAAEIIFQM